MSDHKAYEFNSVFDKQVSDLAQALGCKPGLVIEIWQKLHLDVNEDPHELASLKSIVKQYDTMIDMTEEILSKTDALPAQEKDRLLVEGDLLLRRINTLKDELCGLRDHRQGVIDRNPNVGGKDTRADNIAEFVALIYEATNRQVTFGHLNGEPTTDFGKSVRQMLEILANKRLEVTDKNHRISTHITNWRQPAHKAAKRRKL